MKKQPRWVRMKCRDCQQVICQNRGVRRDGKCVVNYVRQEKP